jgi:hypothetical protein
MNKKCDNCNGPLGTMPIAVQWAVAWNDQEPLCWEPMEFCSITCWAETVQEAAEHEKDGRRIAEERDAN